MVDNESNFCFDSVCLLIDDVSHPNLTSVLMFGSFVCFSPNHVFEREIQRGKTHSRQCSSATRRAEHCAPISLSQNKYTRNICCRYVSHVDVVFMWKINQRVQIFIRDIWSVYGVYSSRGIQRRRRLTRALAF